MAGFVLFCFPHFLLLFRCTNFGAGKNGGRGSKKKSACLIPGCLRGFQGNVVKGAVASEEANV